MSSHLDNTTGFQTVEVTCQRALGNGQFAAGVCDYQFTIARPNVWSPADSYFVIEAEICGAPYGVGTNPKVERTPQVWEGISLAEDFGSCLFTSAYAQAGGQIISSVNQYLPQVAAIDSRLKNSWAWSKSVGQNTFVNGPFHERVAAISASQTEGSFNGGTMGISGGESKDEIIRPSCLVITVTQLLKSRPLPRTSRKALIPRLSPESSVPVLSLGRP